MKEINYDVFSKTCVSQRILETVSGKWAFLTIHALKAGKLRNAELGRKLEGISPKMLSQTLRALQKDGLVSREVFAEVPPRVEYQLSSLGQELSELIENIRLWTEANADEIAAYRAKADE